MVNKYNGSVLESYYNPSMDLILSFIGREGIGVYMPGDIEEPDNQDQVHEEKKQEIERR